MKRILILFLVVACLLTVPISINVYANSMSSAQCMVTIEASSGRILYGHNYQSKRPMASVTKIATAITVLQNCPDINAKISIPQKAVGVEGSSIYLQAGERISVLDLLYGLMLQSGNDCATALALSISGSIKDFASLMNQTATLAGATNTNFTNPHGLHDDNHYTTALDLAKITAYAMKNPTFKQIVSTKLQKIERDRPDGITLIPNKNKLLKTFDGADGVKTGFTKKAGRCLVASATRNNMQVISVVLNCGPMFQDCASLMESAFREYSLKTIDTAHQEIACAPIKNCKQSTIYACVNQNITYPLKANEALDKQILFDQDLSAPIKKGTPIGKITYTLHGKTVLTHNIVATTDAQPLTLGDYLKDILHEW